MRHAPRLEIIAMLVVGYVTFAIGEAAGMSGIIATMFGSMMLGIYARPHLSANGSLLADFFLQQVACLMDTGVFLLTGFCVVQLTEQGWKFGLIAMGLCLVARAVAVFPMGLLTNAIKGRLGRLAGKSHGEINYLTPQMMFMMWHAGLRGAISLTLCMQLGPWVDALDGPNTRKILQTGTFFLICVFLVVFGGSTTACLKKCGINMGGTHDPDALFNTETPSGLKSVMGKLDERVLNPIFIGSKMERESDRVYEADVEQVLADGLKQDFAVEDALNIAAIISAQPKDKIRKMTSKNLT
jgi:NhaP-type Na+/H+ or K+/H+ antiporter